MEKDVHYISPEDPNRVMCDAGNITRLWSSAFLQHVNCAECLRLNSRRGRPV